MELIERALGRRDRAHRLPPVALLPAARSRSATREARAHVDELMGVFGAENVYFELQNNKIPEQDKANEGIARIARELGRPLVGTADVHYLRREDYASHSALLCVQTKSTLAQPKLRFDTNEFYLKSPAEMAESFARLAGGGPDHARDRRALRHRDGARQDAAARATRRPDGAEPTAYLRRLTEEGLRGRYGDPPPAEAVERLECELRVIGEMGFESYFLIVWDFVKYAKDNGIAVGPGRGSAAGSIVSYALQHHRRRPARVRPDVRALPEPRAQVDAGHRHRLLGQRPRARDPLRAGEVRRRRGRPDHHLRQDGAARGDARRGARAGLRLRAPATGSRS